MTAPRILQFRAGVRAPAAMVAVALLVLLNANAAVAQGVAVPAPQSTFETSLMTSAEIAAARDAGATTIIIPTGGTEQNGLHMITGKHNLIVAETARRIAKALGNALVAPVLSYSPEGDIATREGHMAYPGTISLRPETFAAVLEDTARSFAAHGFKTIVLLGDSGPNQAPQRDVAARLSQEWAEAGVRVIHAETYYAANGQQEALLAGGETADSIGQHAGIRDTSELLAIDPDGVRRQMLSKPVVGSDGDPSRASAEIGVKLLDLKVAAGLEDIRSGMAALTPPEAQGRSPSGDGLMSRLWRMIFG